MTVTVKFKTLPHFNGQDIPALELPTYESPQAAGVDLRAALGKGEVLTLNPSVRLLVPTGLAMELPPHFEAQIRPRSGLAIKHGVTVLNAPGTIDADYRGEIKVILINHGEDVFIIERGMRIAQMVIAPVLQAHFITVDEVSKTQRGEGGFGSTGV